MINAKEIHGVISDGLCGQLKDFSVNKTKHLAQQKNAEKIYHIGWSVGHQLHGFWYLRFWSGIRYTKIDDWYDSLFGAAPGFDNLIYCSFADVGSTSNNGQFRINNVQAVQNALTEVIAHFNNETLPLFYRLKDGNDFLNYLCDKKLFFSWSEKFALKRIMLAVLTAPNRVAEMHNFNLSLWKEGGKEFYSKPYWRGIDRLKSEIPTLIL